MKKSELTFTEGFTNKKKLKNAHNPQMKFDWDKAAELIKQNLDKKNLVAEAGLQGDWNYTGGIIFENGRPTNEEYTFLSSNWATPTLILIADDLLELEIPCFTIDEGSRFLSDSKWDNGSLKILGLKLKETD